jgi:hypothetical protein
LINRLQIARALKGVRVENIFLDRRNIGMKKLMTISILIVLVAFWTYPCQAREVVYFAPDGSEITRAVAKSPEQSMIGWPPKRPMPISAQKMTGDPNLLKNLTGWLPGRTKGANFLKFESPISAISLKK